VAVGEQQHGQQGALLRRADLDRPVVSLDPQRPQQGVAHQGVLPALCRDLATWRDGTREAAHEERKTDLNGSSASPSLCRDETAASEAAAMPFKRF
jgi:hypothetical protein